MGKKQSTTYVGTSIVDQNNYQYEIKQFINRKVNFVKTTEDVIFQFLDDKGKLINCKLSEIDDFTENTWMEKMQIEDSSCDSKSKLRTVNCFKKLVSGEKIRFQNEQFNLDLVYYITARSIAMGFPSQGYESFYRNGLSEVFRFFNSIHNGDVKVYNLCEENSRLYKAKIFNSIRVASFPFQDHNPCRIEYINEF